MENAEFLKLESKRPVHWALKSPKLGKKFKKKKENDGNISYSNGVCRLMTKLRVSLNRTEVQQCKEDLQA